MAHPRKKSPRFHGTCEHCGKSFDAPSKRRYCSAKCIKDRWHKSNYSNLNRVEINAKRRNNRALREKKVSERSQWREKFLDLAASIHTRNIEEVAERLLKRVDSTKNSLVSRSKKAGVECTVTIPQLRQLVIDNYGKKCRYCERLVTVQNMTVDHLIPVSKGGGSTLDNLQVICKTSNAIKGSLDEDNFVTLMTWLKTQPESLSKDVMIRLARGVC